MTTHKTNRRVDTPTKGDILEKQETELHPTSNVEPEASQPHLQDEDFSDAPSARRKLFSFGLPAAAALVLSACGKAVTGGGKRTFSKEGQTGNGLATGAAPGNNNGGNPDGNPNGGNPDDGNPNAGNPDGGNPDNPLGNGNTDGTEGNPPAGGENPGPDYTDPKVTTLNPCDGIGIDIVNTAAMTDDTQLIDEIAGTKALKIWGRSSSALVALKLNSNVPAGSSVILAAPTDDPNQHRVLAVRSVMNTEVDVSGAAAMIAFDAVNLSGLTSLLVAVIEPMGASRKHLVSSGVAPDSPASGRFQTMHDGKPVYDAQVALLPDEGNAKLSGRLAEYSANFPISGGGFGFSIGTDEVFQAVNLRTDGYLTSGPSESAHIAHAETTWSFPAAFSSSTVLDLLGRDISASFQSGKTSALKDYCNFVVLTPSADGEVYFRYVIGVG